MLGNFFKKKITNEYVEETVYNIIDHVINDFPTGQRDFSVLNNLDEEIINHDIAKQLMTQTSVSLLSIAQERFFKFMDMDSTLKLLHDLSTMPSKHTAQMTKTWLSHEKLFKNSYERAFSTLSVNEPIDVQFKRIEETGYQNVNDLFDIKDTIMTAYKNYQEKDSRDLGTIEGMDDFCSIVSEFMLTYYSEKKILSAKGSLVALALNSDYIDRAFDIYTDIGLNFFAAFYFMPKNSDGKDIPITDILISEAIFKTSGYDINLQDNIDLFTQAYKNKPEMNKQFELLNKIYKYLNINIQI